MSLRSTLLISLACIALGICLTACANRMSTDTVLPQQRTATDHAAVAMPAQRYREAPLPAGFVEPAMLMQPMLQTVPAHRAVEAQTFSQCFRHIKRNDIPMTAPVVMAMESDGDALPRSMKHMRFVFPDAQTESPVTVPGASVVDVPEKEVLVMYMQGVLGRRADARCITSDACIFG